MADKIFASEMLRQVLTGDFSGLAHLFYEQGHLETVQLGQKVAIEHVSIGTYSLYRYKTDQIVYTIESSTYQFPETAFVSGYEVLRRLFAMDPKRIMKGAGMSQNNDSDNHSSIALFWLVAIAENEILQIDYVPDNDVLSVSMKLSNEQIERQIANNT